MAADHLLDAFFVARVQPAPGAGAGGVGQRLVAACRWAQQGRPASTVAPSVDAAAGFCFPLGVEAVRPSAYLVTAEFSFTLTGGDGGRVHGVCRRTADPTHRPPPGSGTEARRWPQVLCLLSPHPWRPFWGKVLEVVEQLLGPHAGAEALPPDAPAALFLASLPRLLAAAGPPMPPLGAVVRVPLPYSGAPVSVDRMRRALSPGPGGGPALLGLSADAIELEVPPDLGNGPANAGVSLARLLWFLTPRQAVTLVASLLLERRVILVARDADTVSAAVHAANALLHPFRWQHIFLPLLPLALKDYLAAPMPYLVGIQADCLPLLRGMPLEETVMFDLDCLGSCTPPLGGPADDYHALPYARQLEDVFEVVRDHTQSPTEFDSTPKCAELLQDFFLRLVGSYRRFVRPDDGVTPAALALGIDRPLAAPAGTPGGTPGSGGSRASSTNGREAAEDEHQRAHGFLFDQAAFVASHRRKAKVAAFLQQFRSSQMLEVWVNERLALAAGGYATDDPFERRVAERVERQAGVVRIAGVPLPSAAASKGRIGSLLRKASAVVKQGGRELVAAVKQAGGPAATEDLQAAGRSQSGPNLRRPSPLPTGAAHSRGNSFSGSSRMGSRSSSYSNLSRPSANLAALNGGVQPSLEQLRPDMFFGLDDDDDDASSVASEPGPEAARPAAAAARNTAAPLSAAMTASRSFGSLSFQHPAPTSYMAPVLSLPPLGAGVGSGPVSLQPRSAQQAAEAASAAAARTPGKPGAAPGAAADGLASKRAAASPALIDLESPAMEAARWRQKQAAYNHSLRPTPQQLFATSPAPLSAAAGAAVAAAGGAAAVAASAAVATSLQCSSGSSGDGWATFGDSPAPAAPPVADARSFGSPVPRQASASSSPLQLLPSIGPLGSGALLGSLVHQATSAPSAAASSPQPQQQMQAPAWMQQPAAAQQHQQRHQQPMPPPPFERAASQPQQQPQFERLASQAQQQLPRAMSQQQPQQQAAQLHRVPSQQRQPAPGPPSVLLEGLASSSWASFGDLPAAAQAQASQPAVPAVCRDSIHSPLALGMSAVHEVHRSASSSGGSLGPPGSGPLAAGVAAPAAAAAATPRRSSSSGTGTASGGSFPQSPLSVTRDAFAEVTALAAASASQHAGLPPRRTSSQGIAVSHRGLPPPPPHLQQHPQHAQQQHQQHHQQPPELAKGLPSGAWRSSSTSSWAEFEAAPAPDASNPFLDPPAAAAEPLARQVTADDRAKSWGDWSGPLPAANCWAGPSSDGAATGGAAAPTSELAGLRLH